MTEPKKAVRFIISCPARSGSTMLNILLASHPDIVCHGEALVGDKTLGFLAGKYAAKRNSDPSYDNYLIDLRNSDPESFLREIIFDPQGEACVGAKFKTDEAYLKPYAGLQTIIREDLDIRILMLSRRNILAQYVSHTVVASQTGTFLVRGDGKRPEFKPFKIDIDHCLEYVRIVMERQTRAAQDYADHPLFEICYEDLVYKGDEVMPEILSFLGVDVRELTTDSKKILPAPSDLVINFQEVTQALVASGLVRAEDLKEDM